jgi:hypothetical protein
MSIKITEPQVVIRKFGELEVGQVFKQFPDAKFQEYGYFLKVSDELCYNFESKKLIAYNHLTIYKSLIPLDAELTLKKQG